MAKPSLPLHHHLLLLSTFFLIILQPSSAEYTIGVNYGTVADNLPPPSQVATFLQTNTLITRIKLFDSNPDILQAFSNTNIQITVSVPNDQVIPLSNPTTAQSWITTHIIPFYPQTLIARIAVGNEIMACKDKNLIAHLLPAMKSLHNALLKANITTVQVSTPHSLGILATSEPPSSGRFRRVYDQIIFAPMLMFHRETKTPFMINPYPYFGFKPETLDYALFKPNPGVYDKVTGMTYTNMFEAQLDAVYSAMARLGYGDVEIVVAETGWPSLGDEEERSVVNLENAEGYNGNVVKVVNSGEGTPLMRNRTFETFLFSLFNEDLKPLGTAERNFGLFRPDLTPVYDIGILKNQQGVPAAPAPTAQAPPSVEGKTWCVPKPDADDDVLQNNIDYVCSSGGVDCLPIQPSGVCFSPDTVRSHASYAMNTYYQSNGRQESACDFAGSGVVIDSDPSYDACEYVS